MNTNTIFFALLPLLTFTSLYLNDIRKDSLFKKSELNKKEHVIVTIVSLIAYASLYFILKNVTQNEGDNILSLMIAVLGFVTVLGTYEDLKTKKVNRNMLRIAYIATIALSFYYIDKNYIPEGTIGLKFLLAVYVVSFISVILFSNGIGPSDARMLLLIAPVLLALKGAWSLLLVFVVLIISGATITMVQKKRNNKDSVPLGPSILIPTLIISLVLIFL